MALALLTAISSIEETFLTGASEGAVRGVLLSFLSAADDVMLSFLSAAADVDGPAFEGPAMRLLSLMGGRPALSSVFWASGSLEIFLEGPALRPGTKGILPGLCFLIELKLELIVVLFYFLSTLGDDKYMVTLFPNEWIICDTNYPYIHFEMN